MSDSIKNFTRDGSVGSGIQTTSFDFNTQIYLSDTNAAYVFDLVFSSWGDGGSPRVGGRWGGIFQRNSGGLGGSLGIWRLIPPTSVTGEVTMSIMLPGGPGTDVIRFNIDYGSFGAGGSKWWRVWMNFYAKDNLI